MNHIFRTIWSIATQTWHAASEIASVAGKKSTKSQSSGALAAVILGLAMPGRADAQGPPAVIQLPSGGVVARGTATISKTETAQAASMMVNQSSQRAVVNWDSFNLGSAATLNFVQPNAQAVTLNRVNDSNPSQIFGHIQANGQVFITNSNGVYFAPGSSVDVGALTATTHSISDDNFMSGRYAFERNSATGKIINEGHINATLGGYVALLAPDVQNSGVVVARAGTVAMAAGELITLKIDDKGSLAGITTTPSTIASLIENKQAVQAPDGQIILSSLAVNKLQGGIIRNSGSLEANSLVSKGGKIFLEGDDITLASTSKIDATGKTGGGTVLVGGDWQGSGDMRQATRVTMEAGASIDASAIDRGDGGKVVLWSDVHNADSVTRVNGSIKAGAGSDGGNGGQVETSGHFLNVDDLQVSTASGKGHVGEWLLDPYDITITNTAAGTTWAAGTVTSGTDKTYTPSVTSTILASSITGALATGNVTVSTGAAGSPGADTGNIAINAALTWTSAYKLKLSAAGGVSGTGAITMNGAAGTGVEFNQEGNSTYTGIVTGTNGKVTKSGNGRLTFGNFNNYYLGGTYVTAGTLTVGSNGALVAGKPVVVSNGASVDGNGYQMSYAFTLNGTGVDNTGVLKNSSATTSNVSGTGGSITLAGNSSIVGSFAINMSTPINGAAYTLTLGGTALDSSISIAINTGSASGSTAIIKEGTGTWGLTGASTFSGDVYVNNGILRISNATALGNSTGSTTVKSGASVSIAGAITSLAEPFNLSGYGYSSSYGALDLSVNNGTTVAYSGTIALSGNTRFTAEFGTRYPNNTGTLNFSNAIQTNNYFIYNNVSGKYKDNFPAANSADVKTSAAYVGVSNSSGGLTSVYGTSPTTTYALYSDAAATTTLTDASISGTAVFSGVPSSSSSAGSYTTQYSSGLSSSSYVLFATTSSNVWTVTKAPLTVTATAASKTYDGQAYSGGNGVTYSGWVNNEGTSALGGSLSYSGTSQGAIDAGTYVITPSGHTSTNYDITYANGALTVNKAPLTVTAKAASKTYDGQAYSGGNGVDYSGFVNNEGSGVLGGTVAYSGTSQGATDAGTYVITPSGHTSTNYDITYANGALTVNKAPLTVTAKAASKTYDGQAYSGGNGVDYSGFVNNEGSGVLGGTVAYSGTSQGATDAGTYVITPSGHTSTNYDITYASGALTITAVQSVSSTKNFAAIENKIFEDKNNSSNSFSNSQPSAETTISSPTQVAMLGRFSPDSVPAEEIHAAASHSGLLAVTFFDGSGGGAKSSSISFEQNADMISLESSDAQVQPAATEKLTFSGKLTSFLVASSNGAMIEYQGGIVNKHIVIVASSDEAKIMAKENTKIVLASAVTMLGKGDTIVLAQLDGAIIDMR